VKEIANIKLLKPKGVMLKLNVNLLDINWASYYFGMLTCYLAKKLIENSTDFIVSVKTFSFTYFLLDTSTNTSTSSV